MNKLFSKIVSAVTAVAVSLFLSSGSLQIFVNEIEANAAETVIYGDVNRDGRVNIFDLCLIKQEIINPGTTSINLSAADVNADGTVDVKDVIEIQDFLLCRANGFTGSVKKSINELDRSVVKKSVSSKDMPEGYNIQVTGDMAALAKSLQTPEEIYKYVANTVNTEFYNGLRKGAIGTFEQNSGNDYDQASFLLAMFTYMDYDASYAMINAIITADDLMAMTYSENLDAAISIYTSQGKFLSKQSDGTYSIERVGIVFDYNNTRYFLDPSFKRYEKNPDAVDIEKIADEIDNTYLNDSQDNYYSAVIKAESAYNNQNLADAFPQYQIVPQEFGLPSYKIVSDSETDFSVDTVDLYIGNKKAFSSPAAYLYNHNLTIEYEFVEYDDPDVQEYYKMFLDSLSLNSVDDLTKNLGAYEKQVLIYAVVKLDGQKIAVGTPGNLGDKEQLQLKIQSNGKEVVVDKELTYGALYSIIFDSQIISPYEIADLYSKLPQTAEEQSKLNTSNIYGSETMMNTLSLIGKTYFSQVDTNNTVLANMSNSYYSRDLSVAVVDYTPEIRTDNYVRLTGNGKIGIDVIGNRTLFTSRNSNTNDESKLRYSAGYLSSYLEGAVLQEMTGIQSVSTAQVFSQATEQNIDIIHISIDNLSELDNCKMSTQNKADITEYANQGMIITVPKDEVTMNSWSGTGYIVYDPQTENTLYIINNNLNGGSFCSWVTLSFMCDLALYFVECTWAFSMIMFSISSLCLVPLLGVFTFPGIAVGLVGLGTLALGVKFTFEIGTHLRDNILLYMQYRDGDLEAGEQLKYNALNNVIFIGVAGTIGRALNGIFAKCKLDAALGKFFSNAFANTLGGYEAALDMLLKVSPQNAELLTEWIAKSGSKSATVFSELFKTQGIKGVTSVLEKLAGNGEILGTVSNDGATFIDYTNFSGNKIRIPKQNAKTSANSINAKLNSSNLGEQVEAKVGNYINQNTNEINQTVIQFGNKIKSMTYKNPIGDIDVLTEDYFIEAKASWTEVNVDQILKYVDPFNSQFFNFEDKEVILYVDTPIDWTSETVISDSKTLNEWGVKIVNSLEELLEAMK